MRVVSGSLSCMIAIESMTNLSLLKLQDVHVCMFLRVCVCVCVCVYLCACGHMRILCALVCAGEKWGVCVCVHVRAHAF